MAIELVIPAVGESISEVEVGEWLKQPGEAVAKDEAICEIESDKATVEVFAPVDGVMGEILKQTGEVAAVGDVVDRDQAVFAALLGDGGRRGGDAFAVDRAVDDDVADVNPLRAELARHRLGDRLEPGLAGGELAKARAPAPARAEAGRWAGSFSRQRSRTSSIAGSRSVT